MKRGEKVPIRSTSQKQEDYINYLMAQLGYDMMTWDWDDDSYYRETESQVEWFIESLEEELEDRQIMGDVFGHGQE